MMNNRLKLTSALSAFCLLAGSAFAAGEGWTDDFAGAKETAATESKDMLLEFTGSDWCPPCKELYKNVFSHDSFTESATEHFVLVELDFPSEKPQSDALREQNQKLQETYAIEGYPTVILTDAEGKPYAETGYRPGGPEEYFKHLSELKQVRVDRDKHFAAAAEAEGIEKAKHLHEGLQLLGDDLALAFYVDVVEQVIALDADNAAGLKGHYEGLYEAQKLRDKLQAIMEQLQDNGDGDAAIKAIDEILAEEDLPAAFRQEVLMGKCEVQYTVLEDEAAAKVTIQEAIAADPDTELAMMLRAVMEQIFSAPAE